MADVMATCTECGAEMKVSQFADPEQVKCKECGGKLQIPEQVLRRSERYQKQQKKDADPISPLVAMHRQQQQQRSTVTAAYDVSKHTMKRRAKGTRIWVWTPNKLTLLIIFIVGTGILSALRFLPFLGDEDLQAYRHFGAMAIGVAWLIVSVDAFHDNVMHGLLCIFVPFYFLYYLYSQCDSFLLRVGVGILLIPFGIDALLEWWRMVAHMLSWMGAEHLNEDF